MQENLNSLYKLQFSEVVAAVMGYLKWPDISTQK